MKKVKYALLLVLFISAIKVSSDIILYKNPQAKIVVKIENLSDYPDIAIIGVSDCLAGFSKPKVEKIDSTSCIEVHKACQLTFYAVKKDYLEKKGIKKIKWERDMNVRKANQPVDKKDDSFLFQNVDTLQYNYIIAGFKENSMVIIRTSETSKLISGESEKVYGLTSLTPLEALREELKLQKTF